MPGQLCMDNISMGLNESDDSSILDSSEESVTIPVITVKLLKFYRDYLFFQLEFFCMLDTVAITSSCGRLSPLHSLNSCCFRFMELVHVYNVICVYL